MYVTTCFLGKLPSSLNKTIMYLHTYFQRGLKYVKILNLPSTWLRFNGLIVK